MLGNVKFIARVETGVAHSNRFTHSWDILVNTWNKFHTSAQSCIILYIIIVVVVDVINFYLVCTRLQGRTHLWLWRV